MEELIKRLKLEKQQFMDEWKKQGLSDGKEDAKELSYGEFKLLEKTNELDENLRGWLDNKRIQYLENPDEELYIEGWLEGVLSVWDSVQNNL